MLENLVPGWMQPCDFESRLAVRAGMPEHLAAYKVYSMRDAHGQLHSAYYTCEITHAVCRYIHGACVEIDWCGDIGKATRQWERRLALGENCIMHPVEKTDRIIKAL